MVADCAPVEPGGSCADGMEVWVGAVTDCVKGWAPADFETWPELPLSTATGVESCGVGGGTGLGGDVEGVVVPWGAPGCAGCGKPAGPTSPWAMCFLSGGWVVTTPGPVFNSAFLPAQPEIAIMKHSVRIPIRKCFILLILYVTSFFLIPPNFWLR